MEKKLILASSSPRRQELLKQVGIEFSVRVAEVDETEVIANDSKERVKSLALLKGRNVSLKYDNEVILSADTIVAYNNQMLEKPKDKDEAYEMIRALSGTKHEVYTGAAIRSANKEIVFVEQTVVEFWLLEDEEIKRYIQTNEPYDKAGGYGIQSMGALFVKQIVGDYYTVVGLPLSRVVRELKSFGIG